MNTLVAYGETDSEPDQEETETIEGKAQGNVKRLISVLPPVEGSTKQRVRISVPKLDKEGDSDEEIPVPKRAKQTTGVGLTAILPRPKGAMKEPEKPVKLTTQNMLPYSVLKKKQDAMKPKRVKQCTRQQGNEEESDEEPATFFSHLESGVSKGSAELEQVLEPTASLEMGPIVVNPVLPAPVIEPAGSVTFTAESNREAKVSNYEGEGSTQFESCYSHTSANWNDQSHSSTNWNDQGHSSTNWNDQSQSRAHWNDQRVLSDKTESEQSMDEEAFRRLAGGRNLKLKSESLDQIVELDESQVQGRIKDYQKYMTEEQPTLPKGPAPTNMQKKKHQLHYLIHQAQAREVELRNHWAQAAQNKRQSGMKYGFF